jgi:hypothetical protein
MFPKRKIPAYLPCPIPMGRLFSKGRGVTRYFYPLKMVFGTMYLIISKTCIRYS